MKMKNVENFWQIIKKKFFILKFKNVEKNAVFEKNFFILKFKNLEKNAVFLKNKFL